MHSRKSAKSVEEKVLIVTLITGKEEYEIDRILCHRGSPSQRSFLIQWKGYSTEEDSWVPERDLKNAKSTLNNYKK